MNGYDQKVITALQFNNNLPELKTYFNKAPFIDIKFDTTSQKTLMMDSGYTHNLTTKFWRILKTIELIETHKTSIHMSTYLLEVFTNQCLSFADILATWINHFLGLQLKGIDLSTHRKNFIEKFKDALLDKSKNIKIDEYYEWSSSKLYPYRNILHHMGELSGAVAPDPKWKIAYVCVPKENEWDFVQLRKDLKNYPSQTAFQIINNQLNLPNYLTGDPGDSHKYESIVDFSTGWINKIYDMATLFVEVSIYQLELKSTCE